MFKLKDSKGANRYVGASKARVIDNRDPQNRRRIRVDHPILGETTWIEYLNDFGTFSMPAVGEIVFVECESAVYEFPYAWGKAPKGSFAAPDTPERFKKTVPSNRGFYSPGGNFIELDDGEATGGSDPNDKSLSTKGRGVRITTTSGHKIDISDDPDNGSEKITIADKSGDSIVFDSSAKTVTISSQGDMTVSVVGTETHTVANYAVNASGTAELKGGGGTTVGSSSSVTKVDGQQVQLAGGGPGVARLGDRAIGIGNLGGPVTSTIIQGSSKASSG